MRLASFREICRISARSSRSLKNCSGFSRAGTVSYSRMNGEPLLGEPKTSSVVSIDSYAAFPRCRNVVSKDCLTGLHKTHTGSFTISTNSTFEACDRVVRVFDKFYMFLVSLLILVFFSMPYIVLIPTAVKGVSSAIDSCSFGLSLVTGRFQAVKPVKRYRSTEEIYAES